MARRYRRGAEPLEDLEQVASLALVRAVEGLDARKMHISRLLRQATARLVRTAAEQSDLSVGVAA